MPFFSTRSRAEKIIENVPVYIDFRIVELDWETFRDKWLVGLENDGVNVGLNWPGKAAVGFDVAPESVKRNIEYH